MAFPEGKAFWLCYRMEILLPLSETGSAASGTASSESSGMAAASAGAVGDVGTGMGTAGMGDMG